MYQKTLENEVKVSGNGICDKRKIAVVTLKPAPENHGIVFHRKDLDLSVKASLDNVINDISTIFLGEHTLKYDFMSVLYDLFDFNPPALVKLSTFLLERFSDEFHLDKYNPRIRVVEHLLGAVVGFGLDNLLIEVNGDQLPTFDNSTMPYITAFKRAGIKEQKVPKRYLVIDKEYTIHGSRDEYIKISPYDGLHIKYTIQYKPPINTQTFELDITPESFEKEIARARTFTKFGLRTTITSLAYRYVNIDAKNSVLCRDGNFFNTVRYNNNEPVRHKILDFIGVLGLLNFSVLGKFEVYKGAHHWDLMAADYLRKLSRKQDFTTLNS